MAPPIQNDDHGRLAEFARAVPELLRPFHDRVVQDITGSSDKPPADAGASLRAASNALLASLPTQLADQIYFLNPYLSIGSGAVVANFTYYSPTGRTTQLQQMADEALASIVDSLPVHRTMSDWLQKTAAAHRREVVFRADGPRLIVSINGADPTENDLLQP
jgi:hypothetical protein